MNTQPQPFNSMVPALVETSHGAQQGMTMEDAKRVYASPGDLSDWLNVLNLASACYILGYDAEAFEEVVLAVEMFPCAASYINLAVIFGSRGQFTEALYYAEQAYNSEPQNKTAATIYSEALLRAGRWNVGWPLFHNYYDSKRVSLFRMAIPEWTGQSLKGKRLLLIEGGGFGDNFFFLRWVRELKQQGAHITYLCPTAMTGLMENQWYIDRVIPTVDSHIGELRVTDYDFYLPLLALGGIMGKTIDNSKNPQPWIGSTGGDELNLTRPSRIGFCWQAAEAHLPRPFRSLDYAQSVVLRQEIRLKNADCVDLVPKANPELKDWTATARRMRGCDLIITVDTGVAHLAGAMGLPTWVLLPGFSAWYYGLNSLTSPLYPTMRLFRNHVRGLDIAVNACCKALESWKR